jgi:hypothetical protein
MSKSVSTSTPGKPCACMRVYLRYKSSQAWPRTLEWTLTVTRRTSETMSWRKRKGGFFSRASFNAGCSRAHIVTYRKASMLTQVARTRTGEALRANSVHVLPQSASIQQNMRCLMHDQMKVCVHDAMRGRTEATGQILSSATLALEKVRAAHGRQQARKPSV